MTSNDSVFSKPITPRNSWQLFSWLVFEPFLLDRYSSNLNLKQKFFTLSMAYSWLITISLALYLVGCAVTATLDTPSVFSVDYKDKFIEHYQTLTSFEQKFAFVFQENIIRLSINNALEITLGLLLATILPQGVCLGLCAGLSFTLLYGLYGSILGITQISLLGDTIGVILGHIFGFCFGLGSFVVSSSRTILLTCGLILSLILPLSVGLVLFNSQITPFPFAFIVGIGLSYWLTYFRLYFYPYYFIRCLFSSNFHTSPYLKDAFIWLPIWGMESQFRRLALATPEDALKFVRFLREYRPLQTKLADSIAHAACAGTWLNQPLAFESLKPPFIETEKFKPSHDWLDQLSRVKNQLIAYRHQTQLSLRQQQFSSFLIQLESFIAQTLVENKRWRDEYLQALSRWKTVALEEQRQLKEQAKLQEPITANVYLAGEALRPDTNDKVFLGRNDLKDELARRIYSAQQMPLFLFQGQRRVGKTSLLNFLEPLLGSGFKVVYQDLQSASSGSSVNTWLADLQMRISRKLNIPVDNAVDTKCYWLTSWQLFESWLQALTPDNGYKLILAFDEYEQLHNLLQIHPEQGARLLAAMRSFSQRQNHIVFLFFGAALFSELENPHWGQYFVQAQTFRVDYLHKDDALRLITEPVSLIYPPELPEQMVELTQGHPHLLQLLCSEMVNIANRTPKKTMTQADLDSVVLQVINDSSTVPIAIFWQQFCQDTACKTTVRKIVNRQPPYDKKQLHRLREHGFIVHDTSGLWHLRVPLFERWLKAFDRIDLD